MQWRSQEMFFCWGGGGVQQIQSCIDCRENGVLGAVARKSGVTFNLQMNETHILIRLLRMNTPWNWEFGSALAKLRNFGVVLSPPNPAFGTPLSSTRGGVSSTRGQVSVCGLECSRKQWLHLVLWWVVGSYYQQWH
jgi:hypothetical protein